jgi:gamma-glutamylcyclotransferase (GGCT)/AIG2-like uncharacterized protein YtfP
MSSHRRGPEPPSRPCPGRLPFFVYGTLRPGGANHTPTLRGRYVSVESAVLPGARLYHGPGYPYAVDGTDACPVRGELIRPLPDTYDAVLADLDRLEEYVPGEPGNLYERVPREVVRADGVREPAWVYLAGAAVRDALRVGGRPVAGNDWRPGGAGGSPDGTFRCA